MRWLIAIAGAVLGAWAFEEAGFALAAALLGFMIGWTIEREQMRGQKLPRPSDRIDQLTARVEQLERIVAELRGDVIEQPVVVAEPVAPPAVEVVAQAPPQRVEAPPAQPNWFSRARNWLWGGNTVVRAGVLILTIGVGLLAKYAAEHSVLPVELRLGFAAAIGLVLVVLGYRLRRARPGFGTALQGGGVAAMYLSTFFASYAYHLLPTVLTLVLLVSIAAFSTVIAVVQDAVELAVFGAIGGFLAPVLAAKGEGSHVELFAYYALLNATIAASALYRSWRLLNWVGFLFTFGIASAWGALKYEPEHMVSAAGFLALFFVFYVFVGTLFAIRRPGEQRGSIDTTLTFGTPLATLALAGGMFRLEPMYLALWCAGMAAIYLASASLLLARKDNALRAQAQAYIAVGIGVATLAVPFAMKNELGTALAWMAEACGLVWIGIRQQRLRTRVAGYVLSIAALLSLAVHQGGWDTPVHAMFLALIASGLLFASGAIERAQLRESELYVGRALLFFGVSCWLAGWQALMVVEGPYGVPLRLLEHGVDMIAFEVVGRRVGFAGMRLYPRWGFLLLPFIGLATFGEQSWLHLPAWAVAIVAGYWPLYRQRDELSERLGNALHALAAWGIALWSIDAGERVGGSLADGWQVALHLTPPLLPVALAFLGTWPFARYARGYRVWAAWPILLLVGLVAMVLQGSSDGDPQPLPYLPVINPFDLSVLFWVAASIALARTPELNKQRRVAYGVAALGLFVALNGSIVRTAHFWAGTPFRSFEVPTEPVVQASFTIAWTVLALIAMLIAHRSALRAVWIVGASLLAVVVGKLFLLDLAGLSSGVKIITFLAVGVLVLLIGYFAPVPPPTTQPEQAR